MRSARYFAAVVALAMLFACAARAPRPEIPKDRFGLASQPRVYFVHTTTDAAFRVESAWSRILGRVPLAGEQILRYTEGARVERNVSLVDPAPYVKERLVEALQRELQLTNVEVVPQALDAAALQSFKQKNSSGILVTTTTQYWGMADYRAKYAAGARFIDLANSSEIWSTYCSPMVSSSVDSKTSENVQAEQVFANDGAALNAALRDGAGRCATYMTSFILGNNLRPKK